LNLYIYTVSYPGNGEYHLNYEIKYASSVFDNVYIVSREKVLKYQINFLDYEKEYTNVSYYGRVKWTKYLNFKLFSIADFLVALRKIRSLRDIIKILFRSYHSYKCNSFANKINQIDKLGCHYAYWGNSSAIALTDNRIKNKLCRMHGSDLYNDTVKSGFNFFQEKIVKNISVYCISKHGKRYLEELYGDDCFRILTSYLGVPCEALSIEKKNYNNLDILIIASIDNNKRVLEIIHALSRVDVSKSLCVTIFGDGPQRPLLEDLIKSVSLKVNFKGAVDHSYLKKYLKENNFHFIINFSRSEGIPVSIMEAMTFGIIPIATPVGGVKELVSSKNGFIIDANHTISSFSDSLGNIFNLESEVLEKKALLCVEDVNSKFNIHQNLIKFYNSINHNS
jgi:glycosyltransferase involved in cell wall biosynthesis